MLGFSLLSKKTSFYFNCCVFCCVCSMVRQNKAKQKLHNLWSVSFSFSLLNEQRLHTVKSSLEQGQTTWSVLLVSFSLRRMSSHKHHLHDETVSVDDASSRKPVQLQQASKESAARRCLISTSQSGQLLKPLCSTKLYSLGIKSFVNWFIAVIVVQAHTQKRGEQKTSFTSLLMSP